MDKRDPDELVEHLKAQAAAAAGGPMVVHESEDMDAGVREQFWRQVTR